MSLLLGERQPLSRQQRERVLRRRISYLADDLVIPTWNAAFVCDTEAGVQAALSRLGLDRWKQNVEEKLDTLDDIYRFTVDQTQMSRGHLLELTIILILILELILVFMGVME